MIAATIARGSAIVILFFGIEEVPVSSIVGPKFGGAALFVLGVLGFAAPIFWAQQTKDVANVGDLRIQTVESHSYVIPPILSGGVMALGLVLIGAGFYQRR
jgi:hypothetical protein